MIGEQACSLVLCPGRVLLCQMKNLRLLDKHLQTPPRQHRAGAADCGTGQGRQTYRTGTSSLMLSSGAESTKRPFKTDANVLHNAIGFVAATFRVPNAPPPTAHIDVVRCRVRKEGRAPPPGLQVRAILRCNDSTQGGEPASPACGGKPSNKLCRSCASKQSITTGADVHCGRHNRKCTRHGPGSALTSSSSWPCRFRLKPLRMPCRMARMSFMSCSSSHLQKGTGLNS
jgi:hypothetical protein